MKTFKDTVVGDKMHAVHNDVYKVLPIIGIEKANDDNEYYIILEDEKNEPISIIVGCNDSSTTYYDEECNKSLFYISKKNLMAKLNFDWSTAEEKSNRYLTKANKIKNIIFQIKES